MSIPILAALALFPAMADDDVARVVDALVQCLSL